MSQSRQNFISMESNRDMYSESVFSKIQQYGIYNHVPQEYKDMFEEGKTAENTMARKFVERQFLTEIKENVLDNASLGIYARFENGVVVYEGGKRMENLSEGLELTVSHGTKFFVHFFCKHVEASRILRGEDPFTGKQAIMPYVNPEEQILERENDEEAYQQRISQCIEIQEWDDIEKVNFTIPQMAQIAAPIEEETYDHEGSFLNMDGVTFFLYKSSSYPIGPSYENVKIEEGYCVLQGIGRFMIGGLVCPRGPVNGRITIYQHDHQEFSIDNLKEMVSKYSPTDVSKVTIFEKESIHGNVISKVCFVNFIFESLPDTLAHYGGSGFFVSRMMRGSTILIGGEPVYLSCKITKGAPLRKRTGKKSYPARSAGETSAWRPKNSPETPKCQLKPTVPRDDSRPRVPIQSVWKKPTPIQMETTIEKNQSPDSLPREALTEKQDSNSDPKKKTSRKKGSARKERDRK